MGLSEETAEDIKTRDEIWTEAKRDSIKDSDDTKKVAGIADTIDDETLQWLYDNLKDYRDKVNERYKTLVEKYKKRSWSAAEELKKIISKEIQDALALDDPEKMAERLDMIITDLYNKDKEEAEKFVGLISDMWLSDQLGDEVVHRNSGRTNGELKTRIAKLLGTERKRYLQKMLKDGQEKVNKVKKYLDIAGKGYDVYDRFENAAGDMETYEKFGAFLDGLNHAIGLTQIDSTPVGKVFKEYVGAYNNARKHLKVLSKANSNLKNEMKKHGLDIQKGMDAVQGVAPNNNEFNVIHGRDKMLNE